MSSSDSSFKSDSELYSPDSPEEYEDGEDAIAGADRVDKTDDSESDDDVGPDRFDPVADDSFTARYESEVREKQDDERALLKRFNGIEPLSSWFLRSIAYRDFTSLLHGYLGRSNRIPLPACAYNAVRQAFPVVAGQARGFVEEPDSD
eukprot:gene2213-biopygen1979